MTLELWEYALLIGAGIVGGALNIMAGGGSVLTVPAMIFLGVPGPIANGTNRIAILAQNITATVTFLRNGVGNVKRCLTLSLCALPGAALGAYVGASLSSDHFNTVLAWVMVGVLVLILSDKKPTATNTNTAPRNLLWGHILMVGAGFWGGFIQIGIGFILMPIMHRVMGLSLVETNAYKSFIILAYTLVALVIFAQTSELYWLIGAILAVGNSLGGYLGAKLSIVKGDALIKKVLVATISIMVVKLLFF